jgi:hypothetical protein
VRDMLQPSDREILALEICSLHCSRDGIVSMVSQVLDDLAHLRRGTARLRWREP